MPGIFDWNYTRNFETEQWEQLGYDERLKALQKLENHMAHEEGRVARIIEPAGMENYTDGCFLDENPDVIYINERFVSYQYDHVCSSYDAMNTIIHEGRHAYQYDVLNDNKVKDLPSAETIEEWKQNKEYYLENSGDYDNYIKYRFQPTEDDAFNYADTKMKSFQPKFDKDPKYPEHLTNEDSHTVKDEVYAHDKYGENFREKIKDIIIQEKQSAPDPPTVTSQAPPSEEVVKNINNLEKAHISINQNLSSSQKEHSQLSIEIKQLNNRNNEMSQRLKDIDKLQGNSREYAINYFIQEYGVKREDVKQHLADLKEKISEKQQALKPIQENINILKADKEKNLQEYAKQISDISNHPEKAEIMAQLEQSRKTNNITQRDISELNQVAQKTDDLSRERDTFVRTI